MWMCVRRVGRGWRKCMSVWNLYVFWRNEDDTQSSNNKKKEEEEPKWNCETKSRVACREKCQDQEYNGSTSEKSEMNRDARIRPKLPNENFYHIYRRITSLAFHATGRDCAYESARVPPHPRKTTLTNFNNNDNLPVRYGCRRHRQQHKDNSVATGSTLTGQKIERKKEKIHSRNVQRRRQIEWAENSGRDRGRVKGERRRENWEEKRRDVHL